MLTGMNLNWVAVKCTACVTGGTALIEGAALSGVKLLEGREGNGAKIAKAALTIIALASAVLLTWSVGLTAYFGMGLYFPESSLLIGAAAALSSLTVPFHYKAFRYSFRLGINCEI